MRERKPFEFTMDDKPAAAPAARPPQAKPAKRKPAAKKKAPKAEPPAAAAAPEQPKDELVILGARVPRSVHKAVKIAALKSDREMQQWVTEALREKLAKEAPPK